MLIYSDGAWDNCRPAGCLPKTKRKRKVFISKSKKKQTNQNKTSYFLEIKTIESTLLSHLMLHSTLKPHSFKYVYQRVDNGCRGYEIWTLCICNSAWLPGFFIFFFSTGYVFFSILLRTLLRVSELHKQLTKVRFL